jgi:hypothetical protein
MGKHADRLHQQESFMREQERLANERPNEPPPSNTGDCPTHGSHDFTMKGRDGIRRCWYCARRRPER